MDKNETFAEYMKRMTPTHTPTDKEMAEHTREHEVCTEYLRNSVPVSRDCYEEEQAAASQRISDADFEAMERDGNHGHGAVIAMLFMFTIVFATAAGGFWVESCTAAAVWSAIACAAFSAALFSSLAQKVRE